MGRVVVQDVRHGSPTLIIGVCKMLTLGQSSYFYKKQNL
mgnify:CR=1 FL=1